jgi:hypothetical protein
MIPAWRELKSWLEENIQNLKELQEQAERIPDKNRLKYRRMEFEEFLQKMNEIEKSI